MDIVKMDSAWSLIAILTITALAAGWIWLLLGLRHRPRTGHGGARYIAGALALQLSVVMALYGMLWGGIWPALVGLIWPLPLLLPLAFQVETFSDFTGPLRSLMLSVAMIVMLLTLLLRRAKLWGPLLGVVCGLLVVLPVAEYRSRALMCIRAADHDITRFPRHSIYWSLRNSPREVQLDLHAMAEIDGIPHGWSYREENWYALPASVHVAAPKTIHTCPI